jgi:hypothetical protein
MQPAGCNAWESAKQKIHYKPQVGSAGLFHGLVAGNSSGRSKAAYSSKPRYSEFQNLGRPLKCRHLEQIAHTQFLACEGSRRAPNLKRGSHRQLAIK